MVAGRINRDDPSASTGSEQHLGGMGRKRNNPLGSGVEPQWPALIVRWEFNPVSG
jgi:hypothetical protein